MFEHIVLRRAHNGDPISAGQLAEALLYYQKVHLIIDRATLLRLIRQIGTDHVLMVLRRPELSAVYCEEMLGTKTDSVGVSQFHNYVAFTLAGHESVGELKKPQERLQYELERQGGMQRRKAKYFTKAFLDLVPVRKFSGNHFLQGGVANAAIQDLSDSEYVRRAIARALEVTPGGYEAGESLRFEMIHTKLGTVVITNIDFGLVNQRRASLVPPLDPLSISNFLTNILEARADLVLASFYGGDFVTSAATSSIIQIRHEEILRRANLNADSRRQFTEVLLPDSPCLAEVIDSGERTFEEFLALLGKSTRFKDWVRSVNPDEDLLRSYLIDISSKGWIERLPAKSLRYVLTAALDAGYPLAGRAAGFLDNFIVEKLFSGWRPNHFVTGKLGPFLKAN